MSTIRRPGAAGHVLRWLCKASAMLGGVLLIGIAPDDAASAWPGGCCSRSPIQGDVEMVQLACAVGLASFLPYTQWQGANIIVDFFTTRASKRTQQRLDALGALLLGIVAALVCWRTAVGSMAAYDNQRDLHADRDPDLDPLPADDARNGCSPRWCPSSSPGAGSTAGDPHE